MQSFPDDYKKQPVRVGFYDIEETIGKGNFAVVKLARHRLTKSRVAIKIIDKSRLDETNLTKVYREVQIMKLLRHPNVLKLYQVMETKNMLYIVSEYAPRGEMFAHIGKHGKLSEDEARKYFWQIISAVEYCHKHRVVHRDLKAENLLLDDSLNVKIADFGFSNYIKDDEMLKTFCGSPPYAAPEIFEGKEYDGPAIDIWSLGVVLYVLVCAALPFDGASVHDVRDRVLEGRFRVPYFMSTDLEDLIRKLLVKNPLQRYTLEQIKEHPWMQDDQEDCKAAYYRTVNNADISVGGTEGLNLQVLHLMQSMKIDITKTKQSVENDAYDHHTAIYYLLNEKLRQHRTSYPEQTNVTTRIRRASCMADQVLVRGNTTVPVAPQHRLSTANARSASLQYALRELHLGEVKVPSDVGNNSTVPGCVTEFMPPVCQPSYTSRMAPTINSHKLAPSYSPQHSIDTVCEGETLVHHSNDNSNESISDHTCNPDPPQRKQRARGRERRSAVDAMMHMNARRHTLQGAMPPGPAETLFVPANHPLLKQDSSERPPDSQGEDFERNIKIQIVEPTVPVCEQTSVSMQTLKPTDVHAPVPLSAVPHEIGFKDGRRSSDGVNDPFKHLLHKAENQFFVKEIPELRKLLQRSVTPEQMMLQQQHEHEQFMETTTCMETNSHCTMSYVNPHIEQWKSSPLSSQNELMKTLQCMKLQNQDQNQIDVSEMDLAWNGPGPCRRPASYRKISGGVSPIPAHIRKRRTAVCGDAPTSGQCEGTDSMDANF